MTEQLISKLKSLKFESCKTIKTLKDLKNGKVFCEILAFIKSKPLPAGSNLEEFWVNNFKAKDFRKMTEEEIKKTAEELLKYLPSPVPKLDLKPCISRGSSTQRSYLNSYMKTQKNLTPSARRPEPEIYKWIKQIGIEADLKKTSQTGVLICELVNLLEGKKVIKHFFNPAKTLKAAKMNFKSLEDFFKTRKFFSKFWNTEELLIGNQEMTIGLLEDIRMFYQEHRKVDKENLEDLRTWVEGLGVKWDDTKADEMAFWVFQKAFGANPADEKRDFEIGLKALAKIDTGLALKYIKELGKGGKIHFSLLRDLKKHASQEDQDVERWLFNLGILEKGEKLTEISQRCRNGGFWAEVLERTTGETVEGLACFSHFQRLLNLKKIFGKFQEKKMIEKIDEEVLVSISEGDLRKINWVLRMIKRSKESGERRNLDPQEFNARFKTFHYIPPPRSMLSIIINK